MHQLLLCICMLFVLGTAEKQFVTDAVFHFQYQYQLRVVCSTSNY